MRLVWDADGQRWFELGVDHGVLYPWNGSAYKPGVAWNGLTSVSDSPEGADANDLWADNIKYASLRAAETLGGTIEAYTYPDEFAELDGQVKAADGVYFGQQKRKTFGLSYRTRVGNDKDDEAGYKLHLIYGCTASPSEKQYETINDSPDAITFSWEFDTTPATVSSVIGGKTLKPIASITIDSTKVNPATLAAIEEKLYGSASAQPELPSPDEIYAMLGTNYTFTYSAVTPGTGAVPKLSGWYEAVPETDPTEYIPTEDLTVADGKTYYSVAVTAAS